MPENPIENSKNVHTCTTDVATAYLCRYCKSTCKKYGFDKAGKQRFRCRLCKRTSLAYYELPKLSLDLNRQIAMLLKEGCSTMGIGRLLNISPSTASRRIILIAATLQLPVIATHQVFELDEICTFVGSKRNPAWIGSLML